MSKCLAGFPGPKYREGDPLPGPSDVMGEKVLLGGAREYDGPGRGKRRFVWTRCVSKVSAHGVKMSKNTTSRGCASAGQVRPSADKVQMV